MNAEERRAVEEAAKKYAEVKPSEDLVEKIKRLMVLEMERIPSYESRLAFALLENKFEGVATEIANLVSSSRRQENDPEPVEPPITDWKTKRLADTIQTCFDHNRANPEEAARINEALAKLETNE